MTEETPAKVLSLMGVALTSMFFLFAVTVTNANFTQTEKPFPVAFSPESVVALLDNTSNSFSKFVDTNLVEPGVNSYAVLQYNVNYVMDEASPAILAYTGLTSLAEVSSPSLQPAHAQVAGAYTEASPIQQSSSAQGFSIDGLYSLLMLR